VNQAQRKLVVLTLAGVLALSAGTLVYEISEREIERRRRPP
jgi:hypothetical protein